MIDRSQRYAATVFSVTFPLTLAMMTFTFTRFLAPILVWNQDGETARNLVPHLHAYRIFMTVSFLNGVSGVVLLTALYVLLRPVNRGVALFAAFSRTVYVAMWFVQLLGSFSAVRIMSGDEYQRLFDGKQLQALAGLNLASGWDAYYIGLTFYALGSFFFSYLFLKSGYIPRIVAMCGVLASLFEMVCAFAYLNNRGFGAVVSVNWYEMPMALFELTISVWFLVKGIRVLRGWRTRSTSAVLGE